MRRLTFRQKLALGATAAALAAGGAAAAILATGTGSSGRTTTGRLTSARAPTGVGSALSAAAGYLGVSRAQLANQLRAGRNLAEVAASKRGTSTAGLIDAIVRSRAARLRAAAAHGMLSPALERKRLANLRRRVTAQVQRRITGTGLSARELTAAAHYLSISRARLRSELRAGESPAQLANRTPGRSAAGLIAVLLDQKKAALDAVRAAGTLTVQEEAARMSKLRERISAIVSGHRPTS